MQDVLKAFDDCFIIYRPRDVVSGDFYWFHEAEEHIYIAAVDCTGHGVPGALMSMIGNELLDRVIIENRETSPSRILTLLNRIIVRNLKQKDPNTLIKDGMDMGLCVFDKEKTEVKYSGAFNYLFHVSGEKMKTYNGNRFSVGGFFMDREKEFTEITIPVEKGDLFYLSSDGYMDQFGGDRGKKFKRSGFEKVIHLVHQSSMSEQKKIFDQTLDKWQGDLKQLDDILVMGIKI
jgi:serine phosphatase RsbU (regulator of sigma subunit)